MITAFIGCYSRKESHVQGQGQGVDVYTLDSEGRLTHKVGPTPLAGANPSYVTIHPSKKFLFAVSETCDAVPSDIVAAYTIDAETGALTHVNSQPTGGHACCYVEVSPCGKWLLAACYVGGVASVVEIDQTTGALSAPKSSIQLTEFSNFDPSRQESSHVHCFNIAPSKDADGNYIALVCDLGSDTVFRYALGVNDGSLTAKTPLVLKPGSGPRHVSFHPTLPIVYVTRELDSTVSVVQIHENTLDEIQAISQLPADTPNTLNNTGAAICITTDAKHLYCSNRGHDSIVGYSVDATTGQLTLVSHVPVGAPVSVEGFSTMGVEGGQCPRDINLSPDNKFVLCANQNGGTITVYARDEATGVLTQVSAIGAKTPTCIKFL